MKPLKVVKYLVVHCVANRCNKPFSVESLINTGKQKWGQVSYHWYVRRNGDIIPLLSESVQGIHVKGYNWCSLGIVYEGGLDEQGHPADTRTVNKKCPCYFPSKTYAELQPDARCKIIPLNP